MAKIEINESALFNYYNQLVDEVYLLHHVHPTNIARMNLSPGELAVQSEADANVSSYNGKLIGSKKVIYQFHHGGKPVRGHR